MKDIVITYTFQVGGGGSEVFRICIDPIRLEMRNPVSHEVPHWTALDFHRCGNCPLKSDRHPRCPLAVRIAQIVDRFRDVRSFDEMFVEVTMEERTVSRATSAQKGLSSLMGLICAVSGCPLTGFLKPMARFHLPLANQQETIFRAVSMYLLAQYFKAKHGKQADFSLEGLVRNYHELQTMNIAMSERIRAGSSMDATVNAMVILDTFAKALPFAVEDSLEKIEPIFTGQD